MWPAVKKKPPAPRRVDALGQLTVSFIPQRRCTVQHCVFHKIVLVLTLTTYVDAHNDIAKDVTRTDVEILTMVATFVRCTFGVHPQLTGSSHLRWLADAQQECHHLQKRYMTLLLDFPGSL
ncbi:hypothetical protein AOLI_G00260340 [Acnodon oligacanthus]